MASYDVASNIWQALAAGPADRAGGAVLAGGVGGAGGRGLSDRQVELAWAVRGRSATGVSGLRQ